MTSPRPNGNGNLEVEGPGGVRLTASGRDLVITIVVVVAMAFGAYTQLEFANEQRVANEAMRHAIEAIHRGRDEAVSAITEQHEQLAEAFESLVCVLAIPQDERRGALQHTSGSPCSYLLEAPVPRRHGSRPTPLSPDRSDRSERTERPAPTWGAREAPPSKRADR